MLAVEELFIVLENIMSGTPWELLPRGEKGQALTCTMGWTGPSSHRTSWQVLGQKSLQLLGKLYFNQDKVFQSSIG